MQAAKGIVKPTYSSYGYSQTLVTSGVYKLHEQGFRGQGIRIAYLGNGVVPSPFLYEPRIIRETFVQGESGTVGQTDFHENYVANLFLTYIPKIGTAPFLDKYYVLKVKHSGGGWSPDQLAAALEYVIGLPESQRPHLLGMSFGIPFNSGIDFTEYSFKNVENKLAQLKSLGVICFGSSGNQSLGTADWVANKIESVAAINFDGSKWINSNKGKWCFYGSKIENYNQLGVKTFIEGTSYATPQLMGCIASYLSMKVAKGSNLKQILSSLETSLKLDNYIKPNANGLLFQVP
jgi:hypothetical protein